MAQCQGGPQGQKRNNLPPSGTLGPQQSGSRGVTAVGHRPTSGGWPSTCRRLRASLRRLSVNSRRSAQFCHRQPQAARSYRTARPRAAPGLTRCFGWQLHWTMVFSRVFLKGGGGSRGDPPPAGDPELLEAPKASKKFLGLN